MTEPTVIYVQFTGPDMVTIISYFGNPQDPDVYPYQATITTDDERYHVYYNSLPLGIRWNFADPTFPDPA